MWHAKTKDLVEAGKLQVIGIAEEQHPERTRLFMQWQQMDWPVFSDPLNLLGVSAVPITLFVDEHGIIRAKNPKPDELDAFLNAPMKEGGSPLQEASYDFGFQAGDIESLIEGFEVGKRTAAESFRLGVLYRMRYDSPKRKEGDFAKAIDCWSKALAMNPNQYIWRRRIQQYGPRLDKPYSFYDWVKEARQVIIERGETPVELIAEPSGSELATPGKNKKETLPNLDIDQKIVRDTNGLLKVEQVVVPSTDKKKPGYRIHLTFVPNQEKDAHWNNEGHPPRLSIGGSAQTMPRKENLPASSSEARTLDFETATLPVTVSLFFDICQGESGICLHLAKDITIDPR